MPFALVALVLVPAVAGSLRLVELSGGPLLLPANPRLTASPVPVVAHILSAVGYGTVGAFAFGSAMAASILLGFTAIRRHDVARHRAWMTRAYALALGVVPATSPPT